MRLNWILFDLIDGDADDKSLGTHADWLLEKFGYCARTLVGRCIGFIAIDGWKRKSWKFYLNAC